jgi:CRISPR-associated protein (TIGR03986 family)
VKPEDIIEGNQARIAKAKTQYTQIMPVKSGVTFHFRIYFENLTDVELGALLWVLRLPPRHLHKIGMGKPLGMGSVEIKPTLHLLDRASRYKWLFDRRGWFEGDPITALESDFVQAFEGFVLRLMDTKEKGTATCLAEVERIQTLLKMLEGDGPVSAADRDLLEYMEIEHGPGRVNEYKERPVLPDPLHTMRPTRRGRPAPASKPTQPH